MKNNKKMKKKENFNKPPKSTYFSQNVEKFGPDFLKRKRPDELKRDAIRIFKDIAHSKGYVGGIGVYFTNNYNFVKIMRDASNAMQVEENAIVLGLSTYVKNMQDMGTQPDEHIIHQHNDHKGRLKALTIIGMGLDSIITIIDLNNPWDNIYKYVKVCGVLQSMSLQLKDYKYYL